MTARIALIVGSAVYDDPKFGPLRTPCTDADALSQVLADPGIGDFAVQTMPDRAHYEVTEAIEGLFAGRAPTDLVLLYLACHGVKDVDGELYFVTKTTKRDRLAATAIPASWLKEQMRRTAARQVILMLDCCYSGAFVKGLRSHADASVDVRERFEDERWPPGKGTAVLTATNAVEYAWEDGHLRSVGGHMSAFTGAVVQGLRTGAADRASDGFISIFDLHNYLDREVRARGRQTPTLALAGLQGPMYVARSPAHPRPGRGRHSRGNHAPARPPAPARCPQPCGSSRHTYPPSPSRSCSQWASARP